MIDIIVPAYNAHKTLPRLLCSIGMQICLNEIKVIIVDDGSLAGYDRIVHDFSHYIDIEVITLKENLGPALARNAGILNSTAEYIIFADADDIFSDSHAIMTLKNLIIEKDVDMLFSDFLEENEQQQYIKNTKDTTWLFGKIFKSEFLKSNNIIFPNVAQNEDAAFLFICTSLGNYAFEEIITYIWKYNKNSITSNENYFFECYEGYLTGISTGIKFLETKPSTEKILRSIYEKVTTDLIFLYIQYNYFLQHATKEQTSSFLKWARKYYKNNGEHYAKDFPVALQNDIYAQYISSPIFGNYIVPKLSFNDFINKIKKSQ